MFVKTMIIVLQKCLKKIIMFKNIYEEKSVKVPFVNYVAQSLYLKK